MLLTEKQEKDIVLKKHVNTIHCSNNLTLVQRKLFNALLFNAYHELPSQSQYQIPIKKLCGLIGYDSRDYKKLRKSILELITTSIEWSVIDQDDVDENEKWNASAIVSAAKMEKGMCTYEFSSLMRELLHTPKIYGKIDLKVMVAFKSSYGLALYENCIRYQGVSQTQWLSMDIFRKLMGIPKERYKEYSDFRKRVIDIAVKEVNMYSPITVTPEIKRVNRKVTSIRFKFTSKINSLEEELNSDNVLIDKEVINALKHEFTLSDDVLVDVLKTYENDYIKGKVRVIKQSDSYKLGKIRNLPAYLVDALKKDYQQGKSNLGFVDSFKSKEEHKKIQEQKLSERLQRQQEEDRRKEVYKYLDEICLENKDRIITDFEMYLKEKDSFFLYKKFKRMGLENKAVEAMFINYVSELLAS